VISDGVIANATNFNAKFMSRTQDTDTSGNVTLTAGYLKRSTADGITAFAGGGQGSATALTKDINRISTCATAADSVKLPAAVAGMTLLVVNQGAARCDVFPATGEQINGLSANTALSVAAGEKALFVCRVAAQWVEVLREIPLVSGSAASPNLISASGVIPIIPGLAKQTVYIAGNGAPVTAGGVYITAGTIDAQELTLISTDGTNTVTIPDGDGTGTEANGDVVHGLRTVSEWIYNLSSTCWVEKARNGL
jgi:hypothetical protein